MLRALLCTSTALLSLCWRVAVPLHAGPLLQEDLAALRSLESCQRALASLDREVDVAAAAKEALMGQRYSRLVQALGKVNRHLPRVYGELTGGLGDAAVSFTQCRQLLFAHGVTLEVRWGAWCG